VAENLIPGDLTSIANDYSAFDESMAKKIEEELDRLLELDGLPPLPKDEDDREVRDRRRFIIAIARGVVLHLAERNQAFEIELTGAATVFPTIHTE
jgi:hypothetical protein